MKDLRAFGYRSVPFCWGGGGVDSGNVYIRNLKSRNFIQLSSLNLLENFFKH